MAKFGTYLLLFLVLSGNLPVAQILKLPTLLQHFHEHQSRNSQISFVDFLEMHYWGKDINDNDDDRDNQLPFKNETVVCSVYYHITSYSIQLDKPAISPVIIHCQVNESFHLDAHPGSLFRPPRAIG
jgi:hypothetical protein